MSQKVNEPSKDWLRFQNNLKNTSFGIRFGKKLFLNPTSLSGRDITNAMRLLGLNMPKEARIGVDVAQIFASSSTLVEANSTYQNAKTAENLKALTLSSAASIQVFNSIAAHNGWIDNGTASFMNVGVNSLRLVASGGADVSAWIALGMELGMQSESAKAAAEGQARNLAVSYYKTMLSNQALELSAIQTKLQKGEIGLFGFLSEAADKGNLLFGNVIQNNETLQRIFPGLKFLPNFTTQIYAEGSSNTWYGDTKTANYTLSVNTIGEMDEQTARQYIFDRVIMPYTQSYIYTNEFYKSRGKGTLMGAAILSCISGATQFDDNTGLAFEFGKQLLTPQDVGDVEVFKNYTPEIRDSGFSLWKKTKYTREQLLALEDKALIKEMLKDPQVKDTLEEKYSFQTFDVPRRDDVNMDWRKIENFIACMDYISLVRHDPSMKGKSVIGLKQFDFLPDIEKWEEKLKEVYTTSLMRKINTNALGNVAHFVGVKPEKLVKVNRLETDKPAIFAVRG